MSEYLMLGLILLLSLLSHNATVIYAVVGVTALKIFTQLADAPGIMEYFGTHGLNFGIIILTAAILVPIADGTINLSIILHSLETPLGILAVVAGLLAALSGGAGLPLLQTNPVIIPALLVGTMLGVFFFKGIAVGPLIAAGFVYFVMSVVEFLRS